MHDACSPAGARTTSEVGSLADARAALVLGDGTFVGEGNWRRVMRIGDVVYKMDRTSAGMNEVEHRVAEAGRAKPPPNIHIPEITLYDVDGVPVLAMPYIRTAVLKGVPRRRVIFGHVLRNAMVPTVTVIGSQVGWLIGGLVVIETLFVYPGIGKVMVDAAQYHDVIMLEASVLMVAIIYMVANLIADIVVALLNPRIRKGG